ncbi:MAG TPA: hypothetical protein VHU15_13495 [Stellaceae bacterium]|nr:hypothetical protein [Stellaceae bacterium]
MEHTTLLVSPDAEWLLPDSPEFLEALGDPEPDYDAPAFAVKNLGFIKFQMLHESVVEIELHPRNVELPALLAVQEKLQSSSATLFRIKYFDLAWHSEISSSLEHTMDRLSQLCAPVFTPPATERFLVEPRDYATLFTDETNPLRPLVQKWRMSFGHFDPGVLSIAMQAKMLSRLNIVGVSAKRGGEPQWRFIGAGHRWLPDHYHLTAIGNKVEAMPDSDYGGWIGEFFKAVAHSGGPRFDLVTAQMQYEPEAGRPRRTVQYERLLLPWKTPSDEILVTSCARLLDDNVAAESVSATRGGFAERNIARSA